MSVDADVEQALAAGLLTAENGRRVGWAKAFDALRKIDELSEDLRQTRDELKALRRAYSRLVGFAQNLPIHKGPIFDAELKAHTAAERISRHEDAWRKGVRVALEHRAYVEQWNDGDWEKRWVKVDKRREAYRELYRRADSMGHAFDTVRVSPEELSSSCSCGWTDSGPAGSVRTHRFDHATQVVHGCDFKEYKRRLKAGEIPDA